MQLMLTELRPDVMDKVISDDGDMDVCLDAMVFLVG